jgi:putative peptidoglycan lipid II flippase
MFNVASIACAIVLVPLMPLVGLPRITAIAIAVLGRAWPDRRAMAAPPRRGIPLPARDRSARRGTGRILLLMGPGTLGLAATQINLFVNTQLATGQAQAVSWLNYVSPDVSYIGLFGVSIARPCRGRQTRRRRRIRARDTVGRGLAHGAP